MTSLEGTDQHQYDVCLSFAGEQRQYVETVANGLREYGVRVFFDTYEQSNLWGRDLYEHLDWVYRRAARYCVLFASEDYAHKAWTSHERRSAQARALVESGPYVLPVRFDDTEIPGLRPTVAYIDLRGMRPSDLVRLILQKLAEIPAEDTTVGAVAPLPTITTVPRTPEQFESLLAQKPRAWEYLLYCGVLLREMSKLDDKRRDHELRYAPPRSMPVMEDPEVVSYISSMISRISLIVDIIDQALEPGAQESAFGLPGHSGDPARIEHLARRLVAGYSAFLDWAANLRGLIVSDDLVRVVELAARMADRPIEGIRQFVERYVSEVEEACRSLIRPGDHDIEITVTLGVDVDEGLAAEYEYELGLLRRKLL